MGRGNNSTFIYIMLFIKFGLSLFILLTCNRLITTGKYSKKYVYGIRISSLINFNSASCSMLAMADINDFIVDP